MIMIWKIKFTKKKKINNELNNIVNIEMET